MLLLTRTISKIPVNEDLQSAVVPSNSLGLLEGGQSDGSFVFSSLVFLSQLFQDSFG